MYKRPRRLRRVDLEGITMVELDIAPDVADDGAYASLARLRLA